MITVVTTGTLWGGGKGTGSVHTVWVPGALHAAPHSGESPVVVVPVTLRDPVLVYVSLSDPKFELCFNASVV